ncbi:hypothetical protein G7Y89_g4344 [Cudoniella acicularis]|uniref:CENP-V/GFA domain-containing protein n=1 Tax=Cudoniella acicularis TaxID=354080 RepID=A0A8H4RQH4_9HELO|nr:hypothetical protein G7Y89_g4344 [Cudoniella acicularis]
MAPSKTGKDQAKAGGHKHEDVEGEHNEWKFRAPYKVHENDENFKPLYEGSCHCGRVQYQLSREKPLDAKFCHCTTCQVLHGAPFQWAAIFHKENINFTHGHHDLGWYESTEKTTEHKSPCKVSCAYCRAPIMDEGRNMILLFPSLIKFKSKKEKENFDPTKRLVNIPDGLPKWSGMQGKSELIEDSPPEDMKNRKREIEEDEIEKNGGDEKHVKNK